MKKEDFINLLENYSSKYTELLQKRDNVLESIKDNETPDGCPSTWTEIPSLCENNVYELNSLDSEKQCKECWKQVLE